MRYLGLYDMVTVLNEVFGPEGYSRKKFEEECNYYSGGAFAYNDHMYGKQSIIFQFGPNNKLSLFFKKARTVCYCTGPEHEIIVKCNCDEEAKNQFPNWPEYWSAHHEEITLKRSQIEYYLQAKLF